LLSLTEGPLRPRHVGAVLAAVGVLVPATVVFARAPGPRQLEEGAAVDAPDAGGRALGAPGTDQDRPHPLLVAEEAQKAVVAFRMLRVPTSHTRSGTQKTLTLAGSQPTCRRRSASSSLTCRRFSRSSKKGITFWLKALPTISSSPARSRSMMKAKLCGQCQARASISVPLRCRLSGIP